VKTNEYLFALFEVMIHTAVRYWSLTLNVRKSITSWWWTNHTTGAPHL